MEMQRTCNISIFNGHSDPSGVGAVYGIWKGSTVRSIAKCV